MVTKGDGVVSDVIVGVTLVYPDATPNDASSGDDVDTSSSPVRVAPANVGIAAVEIP